MDSTEENNSYAGRQGGKDHGEKTEDVFFLVIAGFDGNSCPHHETSQA